MDWSNWCECNEGKEFEYYGIIVIILLVVSMYKSYLVDLGNEIDSNEINTLNTSFSDIASKFE